MTEPESPHIIAGENAVLARRYAHALYELAAEKNQLDDVAEDLREFRKAVKGNADYHKLVHNPGLTRLHLIKAVNQLSVHMKLGATTSAFLALLARKRRLVHLADIIGVFLNELAMRRGEHVVEVTAAQPLTEAQHKELVKKLEKVTGGKVALLLRQDPGLLGGLTMKWGSRLLDASLKGKLARLERQLRDQQEAA